MHSMNKPGNDSAHTLQNPSPSDEINVLYAGRVFNEDEVVAAVSSTLEFWLTLGKEGEALEKELPSFLGLRKTLLVNSGSSANFIAFATLTSPLMDEDRIRTGDEVITCAAGFATTVVG